MAAKPSTQAPGWKPLPPRIHRGIDASKDGRTKQGDREISNILNVHAQMTATGHTQHVNPAEPIFGDFTHIDDLHTTLSRAQVVRSQFQDFPWKIREAAKNDPEQLFRMLHTREGQTALYEAGMQIEGYTPDPPPEAAPEGSSPPQPPGTAPTVPQTQEPPAPAATEKAEST